MPLRRTSSASQFPTFSTNAPLASSQCFRDTSILKRDVGPLPAFDLVINHEPAAIDWAMPDFVVAFPLPNERATSFAKDRLDPRRVVLCHSGRNAFRALRIDLEQQSGLKSDPILCKHLGDCDL